jgi:hypothetical protein
VSEIITTAGAAGPDAASVEAPVDQQVKSAEDRVAAAVAAMGGPPVPAKAPAVPQDAPPPGPQPSMAELIRAQREARQTAHQETQKRSSLETELKTARDELARAKADRQAFEDDPVGYAKERGWSKEQQLLYGQSLLYDLAPDKADPDFRIKMFEDRQKRDRAAQEREAKTAQEREQAEAVQRQVQDFFQETAAAVKSFAPGSYPETEDWFGGDTNAYMQSLMATAKNMATIATREGRVADLTAPALAAALEAETARRMAARDQRKQTRTPAQRAAEATRPGGMQSVDTMSTRNMNGSGSPRPPALTEKERIERAVQAAFKSR